MRASFCIPSPFVARAEPRKNNSTRRHQVARADMSGRSPRPKLIVFDLDGTLWSPEMYELWGGGAPFTTSAAGSVKDRSGRRVSLLGNAKDALQAIADEPEIWSAGVASSTDEPDWARECMAKMTVDSGSKRSVASCISVVDIAKGRKSGHFERLRKKTGIEYEDMMFFDNEMRNCESVEPLGVFCVYTPRGMTEEKWSAALQAYARGEKSNAVSSRRR